MPSGHGNWTVSSDGGDPVVVLGVLGALVAAGAVAWFLYVNQVVLAFGSAGIGLVLAVSTWVLRRWFTVCHFDPAAAARVAARAIAPQKAVAQVIHHHYYLPAPSSPAIAPARPRAAEPQDAAVAQVVVHRHVIEYAPPAIENRQVIPAAVITAALEAEEIPR